MKSDLNVNQFIPEPSADFACADIRASGRNVDQRKTAFVFSKEAV